MSDLNFDISNGAAAGGAFVKPADHKDAALVIFEPKGSRTSSKFQNADGSPKLEAIADFTAFATKAELEKGKPGTVVEDAIISSGVLAKIIIEKGQGILVGSLEQTEGKGGRQGYWRLAAVDPAMIPKVKQYLQARQEERDKLPDFMS